MSAVEPITAERVREALDDVLEDERFQENPVQAWLGRLWDKLADFFDFDVGSADASVVFKVLFWLALGLVIACLVAVAVWLVARRARLRRELQDPGSARGADAVTARVAELLGAARAAEAGGDLLLALRLYFFALVVGLGERGELRYRDAWTNRELLERGRPTPPVRERLAPIVADLDRKSFGGEVVAREDVRRLEELCASWLPGGAASGGAV